MMNKAGESTKAKILKASQQLMLCQGYNASSVDDVCEKANVKKGAFFHHFKSKEHLVQETLRDFLESAERGAENAEFTKIKDPFDRVIGYVDFIIAKTLDPSAPKNCLLGILSGELAEMNPVLRRQCHEYFENQIAFIQQNLDLAKKTYKVAPGVETQSLAETFISTFQGSMILRKVKQDRELAARNLEHFKRYLSSIFQKKTHKPKARS